MLRGAGGIAIGLPFLEAMLGRNRSVAQANEIPRRCVFFFTSCGPNSDLWWPSGDGQDFTLGPSHAPLAPFQSKLLIPDNVAMETAMDRDTRGPGSNGHDAGTGHCLTAMRMKAGPSGVGSFGQLEDGVCEGISVDQRMAQAVGEQTLYRSLEFGADVGPKDHPLIHRISWDGQGNALDPMATSGEAFDRVFASLATEDAPVQPGLRRRELVLGAVRDDLNRLRGKLGSEDRLRLDAHISSVADIAGRIDASTAVRCSRPSRVEGGGSVEDGTHQIDLLAEALTCDITRVASMQWSSGQSGERFRWLNHDDGHHGLSHQSNSHTEVGEIDLWYATEFARLLARLDAVDAGDGQSLLDYTTVVWVNEQEHGVGNNHDQERMPYVLAGSGGGFFKTGRYHRFADRKAHGELFLSLLHMMGVNDTVFGEPRWCRGPLSELHA